MSARKKNAHCSFCGHLFLADQPWPRSCLSCANTSYLNPLPVAVTLVPVDGGLLCIRRTIKPALGKLALPGGFMEMGESWQEACARELLEETGVLIDPGEVRLFGVHSSPAQGFLLVFGLAGARREEDLPSFAANDETDEMVIIHAAQELAFPLHTRVVGEYFRDRAGM